MFVLFFNRDGLAGVRAPQDATDSATAKADLEFLQRIAGPLQALNDEILRIEAEFKWQSPEYEKEQQRQGEQEELAWIDFFRVHDDLRTVEANKNILKSALNREGKPLTAANLEWALLMEHDNVVEVDTSEF
jgi:hypothetical protein